MEGKVAFITGGSSGIGLGIARAFADAGMKVVIGYRTKEHLWKKSVVSFAEVLHRAGYSTAVFGKWHNTPYWEITPIGPFDRWPTGLGFEYFYGFMGGFDSQCDPPPARKLKAQCFSTVT